MVKLQSSYPKVRTQTSFTNFLTNVKLDLHAIGLLYNDGNPLLDIVQLFLSIKERIADILKEH